MDAIARKEFIIEGLIEIIKSYVRVIENDIQGEIENNCNNLNTLSEIIQDKILIVYKIEEQHNKIKNG